MTSTKNTVTAEVIRVKSPVAAGTDHQPYALIVPGGEIVTALTGQQAAALLGIEPSKDEQIDFLRPKEQTEIRKRAEYDAESEPDYLKELAKRIPAEEDKTDTEKKETAEPTTFKSAAK